MKEKVLRASSRALLDCHRVELFHQAPAAANVLIPVQRTNQTYAKMRFTVVFLGGANNKRDECFKVGLE